MLVRAVHLVKRFLIEFVIILFFLLSKMSYTMLHKLCLGYKSPSIRLGTAIAFMPRRQKSWGFKRNLQLLNS